MGVDGGLVTIKYSKPVAEAVAVFLTPAGIGDQITELDLTAATLEGLSLSITARPQNGHGDGLVNVGFINAAGRDLGTVTIGSDLAKIDCGSGSATTPALKALNVGSMGVPKVVPSALPTRMVPPLSVSAHVRGLMVDRSAGPYRGRRLHSNGGDYDR
jgi:hypothetical protein